MKYTLEDLQALAFRHDEGRSELQGLGDQAAADLLKLLAYFPNEDEQTWPIELVKHIRPNIYAFLTNYTAGGYYDIRKQLEGKVTKKSAALQPQIDRFLDEFDLLPSWTGEALHYSKDSKWKSRIQSEGGIVLRSFLSCATPESTFAYVSHPRAVLHISPNPHGKYLGCLTREHCEREIIFAPGTRFALAHTDGVDVFLRACGKA